MLPLKDAYFLRQHSVSFTAFDTPQSRACHSRIVKLNNYVCMFVFDQLFSTFDLISSEKSLLL